MCRTPAKLIKVLAHKSNTAVTFILKKSSGQCFIYHQIQNFYQLLRIYHTSVTRLHATYSLPVKVKRSISWVTIIQVALQLTALVKNKRLPHSPFSCFEHKTWKIYLKSAFHDTSEQSCGWGQAEHEGGVVHLGGLVEHSNGGNVTWSLFTCQLLGG